MREPAVQRWCMECNSLSEFNLRLKSMPFVSGTNGMDLRRKCNFHNYLHRLSPLAGS